MKCPIICCLFSLTQEMLHVLKEKGPQTQNIFYKIDNIKSFLSLKERVPLGREFDWTNESPLVVAALLKVGRDVLSSMHSKEAV